MKLKEINRTAMQSWSPAQHYPIYLASGTSAQQLDASFNTNASLEFFELNPADSSLDMKSSGSLSTSHRYHKLVWSSFGVDGQGLPSGVLIAGGENGNVILYDPAKIIAGESNVVIAESNRHTGPVRALDINPFQTNLVASGGNESEIYIWDLNNFVSPMTPGPKTQPLEDISCVAWNRQVQHILASCSPSGRTSVWDLRKNDLIIKVSDHSNRMHCSGMAWNPEVATQLAMASEDDRMPLIQMWDLRFAASPLKIFENHTRGVLAMAWSSADPELLLSCGKDGRILCTNPNTAETLYERPTGNQWSFDIQWCPRNPAVFSAAGFDGYINIYSIMGGTSQAQSRRHVDQISNSFSSSDPFGTGQTLPPLELPQSATLPTTINPLKKPPKWTRTPAGASFAFGGKLVSLENGKPNPQQPVPLVAHISQVVTETDLLKRSDQLQATLSSGQFVEFCKGKIDLTEDEYEKTVWSFLKANFDGDSRTRFLELLGYRKEDLALKISAALTKKTSQVDFPTACEAQSVADPNTVAAADASMAVFPPISATGASTQELVFTPDTESRETLDTPEFVFDLIASQNIQPIVTMKLDPAPWDDTQEADTEVGALLKGTDEKADQAPAGSGQWDEPEMIFEKEATELVTGFLAPSENVSQILSEETLEDPCVGVPQPSSEGTLPDHLPEVLQSLSENMSVGPAVEVFQPLSLERVPDPSVGVLQPPCDKILPHPPEQVLQPPSEGTSIIPPVEVLQPPSEGTLFNPPVEVLQPPSEGTSVNPPVEILQPPSEGTLFNPPVEILQPPSEGTLFNPPVEVLQPPSEGTSVIPPVEVLQPPSEGTLFDPPAEVLQPPSEGTLFDPPAEVLQPPSEGTLFDPPAEVLQPPSEETSIIPPVEVPQPPSEETLTNPPVEVLQPPSEDTPIDPPVEVLHPPSEETLIVPPVDVLQPPSEGTFFDPPPEVLQPLNDETLIVPPVDVLQPPSEDTLLGPTVEVLQPPFKEIVFDASEEVLQPPCGVISPDPCVEVLKTPCEEMLPGPVASVLQPGEQLLHGEVLKEPGLKANALLVSAPAESTSINKDVDGLITQALLTGDFEAAVELCLHDNRMADGIILAIAGGTELLEKTQKKYFQRSQSKLNKLLNAVVMKDLRDILVTCELKNWKEALAAVMTYAQPEEFFFLCDLLGSRLEAANDVQLRAQACLCYICAGNMEKLVVCWTKAQEGNNPLVLQDLVEKVVVMRHAVEQTQNSAPTAVGVLLAKNMCEYASLLASQGCLSTALTYLPEEANQVCLQQLRERLTHALGRQDTSPQSVPLKEPIDKSSNPFSARHLTASAQLQYYQPVRTASTVTSWSNQTPTGFLHVPTPPPSGTIPDQSKVEPPNPMYGMPYTDAAAAARPPAPVIYSHQYQPYQQTNQGPRGAGGLTTQPCHYSSAAPPQAEPAAPHPPGFFSQYSQPAPSQISYTPLSPSIQCPSFTSSSSLPLFSQSSTSSPCLVPPSSMASFPPSGPGSPGSYMQLPPLSGVSEPQNGWNDPPTLIRAPKKKLAPRNYTPPAPITAPIMGVDLHSHQTPSESPQFVGQTRQVVQAPFSSMQLQQPPVPQAMNSMNTRTPQTSSEGPPGAPTGEVIQSLQSRPAEKITKKPIPDEHLVLKTTFEGLIQKCLAVAKDPQTKRKLDDANKRMEALYDKLREQTLSPAIVGGLHNIARTVDSRSYTEGLNLHTHIVSSSNFSEISGFMPVLKVILTQANKLGV